MTMTELDALRAEIAALWIALKQVNENQQAIHTNFYRMSARMNLHEAYQASAEMYDQPRGH
jgi:hypothetical protein